MALKPARVLHYHVPGHRAERYRWLTCAYHHPATIHASLEAMRHLRLDVGGDAPHVEGGAADEAEQQIAAHRFDAMLAALRQLPFDLQVSADRGEPQLFQPGGRDGEIAGDALGTHPNRAIRAERPTSGDAVDAH